VYFYGCGANNPDFYEVSAKGMDTMKKLRVFLADDHDVVLEGLRGHSNQVPRLALEKAIVYELSTKHQHEEH